MANKRNWFNWTEEIGSMDGNVPSIKCIFRPSSASSKRFANSFSQETVECFNLRCSIFIISFIQNISASACVEVLTKFNEKFNTICDMSAYTYIHTGCEESERFIHYHNLQRNRKIQTQFSVEVAIEIATPTAITTTIQLYAQYESLANIDFSFFWNRYSFIPVRIDTFLFSSSKRKYVKECK